jgi:hypothetical protein
MDQRESFPRSVDLGIIQRRTTYSVLFAGRRHNWMIGRKSWDHDCYMLIHDAYRTRSNLERGI